jgi:hypothetical protein
MEKVAIVHDGSFGGDNTFYCPSDQVPYEDGQNIQDIREAFHKKRLDEETEGQELHPGELRTISDEIKKDYTDEIKGAWILDKKDLRIINGIHDVFDGPGNDSTCYAINRAAKAVAHKLALKHLGQRARLG